MRFAKIKYNDIANGFGIHTSLFVSGCRRHCKGCFNPETWDFNYGDAFTTDIQDKIIASLAPAQITGLSILGGEPLEPENMEALLPFLQKVRAEHPRIAIWIFTGYTPDELFFKYGHDETLSSILKLTDYLKIGSYKEDLFQEGLLYRGSTNQKILDMNTHEVF